MAEENSHKKRTGRGYRILMVAPTSFFADYGCHVRILEEVRILERLGHKVTIVTYRNGRDVAGVRIERTLPIPWRQDYEVGSSRHKIGFDLLLGLKALQLTLRNRYDVIHGHLHEGALIGLILGQLTNTPVVFDFQGSLTEEMIDHQFLRRDSLVYKPLRHLEQWIDQNSSAILTSSSSAKQILIDQFGCRPKQIRTLPDCVNAEIFRPAADFPAADLDVLRQELNLPTNAKVVVYLGLLAEYQGTGHLLQATAQLLSKHTDLFLLLMGFPGIEAYRRQAADLGIEDRVRFTGRIPYSQAPRYLALGNVAAAPKLSVTESAGKILNYMATGLPTVAYDTPVAREYLGINGLLAERGSVDSLAKTLDQALNAADKNPMLGIQLRDRAIRHYNWLDAGRKIVKTYDELLGQTGSSVDTREWVATRE